MRGGFRQSYGCCAALQAYAAAFFGIPALRWFLNKRRNVAIEARNQARLDALREQGRPGLTRKLAAARKLGESVVIRDRDIVYSSDRCRSVILVIVKCYLHARLPSVQAWCAAG